MTDKRHPYPTRDYIIDKIKDRLDLDEISLSTFEKDLRAMRDLPEPGYYAPIAYSRANNGYYYKDFSYSISNFSMLEEDVDTIEFAAALLQQYRNMPLLENFSAIIDKIMDTVNARKTLTSEEFSKIIHLEKIPETKGAYHIPVLLETIKNMDVIKIKYQPFYQEVPLEIILHPYVLKEFHNRWYVLGLNQETQEIYTYGLDRILEISIYKGIKYKRTNFNADEYFRHLIGVSSSNSKPQKIVLAFSKTQAKYLMTQPLHESQRVIKETKERAYFSFHLQINYELEAKILGWRDAVEVISPKSLRNNIVKHLKNSLDQYF